MKLKKLVAVVLIIICFFISKSFNIDIKQVNADETNKSYETYAQSYFDNLTNNFGRNYHGTCTQIALSMLLSYYDTFHDDNIIPEQYDAISINNSSNTSNTESIYDMISRNDSPGTLDDIVYNPPGYIPEDPHNTDIEDYVKNLGPSEYGDLIESQKNSSLHAKLISMGEEKNYYSYTPLFNTGFGLSILEVKNVLNTYLQEVANFSADDYTLSYHYNVLGIGPNIRELIIDYVEDGIPVYIAIGEGSENDKINGKDRHAVIAYDYDRDKDEIYCHFGYHNNNMLHITPESEDYLHYNSILALTFNTPHSCSNNYVVETKDEDGNVISTNTYCYEHKDIITYDHECSFGAWEKTNTTHTRTCHCTKEEKDLHTFNLNAKYCNVCNYYCNHTYAYQYLNTSLHYTTCSKCSYLKNNPHVFESSTSRYCIDCKRLIMDDGFGQIIGPLSATLVSLNGSYVLPSGNIVLVLEDKEAYYNGTLVFYNRNELPEVA